MFEQLEPDSLPAASDAAVVGAIGGWAVAEAGAAARRLAAIGELVARRCGVGETDPDLVDPRTRWACDLWDATAAEVAAALVISPRRASSQMYLAQSLRERLPRVNALFLAGRINARLVATISWRTHAVIGQAAMAAIDTQIAAAAAAWGPLSDHRVETLIDAAVAAHDPAAKTWFTEAARSMDVQFGKPDDATGTRSIWGRLLVTHAELIQRRLAAIARTVCPADPRSAGQLRAEALGAVFAGADRLTCGCTTPDCPNRTTTPTSEPVTIHILADHTAIEATRTEPARTRPAAAGLALSSSGAIIPTALLAQLIAHGARLQPMSNPSGHPEPRYRPSAALARFIRCRDLTCRFPGCTTPAHNCDIDHAIPYPTGLTHPSNLRALCRKHHLLRTFWTGPDGWTDVQHPDGTIDWTSPTGHTYTTHPGAALFFPTWNTHTGALPPPPPHPATPNRTQHMPHRRRTRTADRAQRIKNRRAHSDTS